MSTKTIPIFGTMEEFGQDPLKFMELARDAGPMVKLFDDNPQWPYVISTPELVREVVVEKNDCFHKNLDGLKVLLGEGLVVADGEHHRRVRQIVAPLFVPRIVNRYAPDMARIAEERVSRWADGQTITLNEEMVAITLDIIVQTMYGLSIWDISEEDDIRKYLAPISGLMVEQAKMQGREPMEASQARFERILKHVEEMDKVIYAIMDYRLANPQEERHDMLSILLRTDLSVKDVRDQMMTFFFAGHDTSSQTLCWVLYLLSQHPEVERKFHAELDRVLGGATPTADALSDLTYLHHIILETMRVYPPNWSNGRRVAEDVEVGGYAFKKGEMITFSQWALHHDETYFDQPHSFIPERWEDGLAKRIPTYAYFPFGGGMRGCTSKDFAMMELMLVLAVVGQKYRVTLPLGTYVRPEPLVTLQPETLHMKLEKR